MTLYGQILTVASRTFFDHTEEMTQESLSPYKMNLPTSLKERIAEAAKRSKRSMSGEIIHTLEEAYPEETYSAEQFLALLDLMTKGHSREELNTYEETLNETLRHFNFDFSAIVVNGGVSFLRNAEDASKATPDTEARTLLSDDD
jgi:hypothetical protein